MALSPVISIYEKNLSKRRESQTILADSSDA